VSPSPGRPITVAAVAAAAMLALLPATATPASAQIVKPRVDKQVLLFLVDRVSLEDLLSVPEIAALARAGGAGLMSVRTVPGDPGGGAFLTLGAGTRGTVPEDRVLAFDPTETYRGERADDLYQRLTGAESSPTGPFLLDPVAYDEANDDAVPGLLGDVLLRHERTVAVFGTSDHRGGRHRPAILVAMDRRGQAQDGHLARGLAPPAGGGGQSVVVEVSRPEPDLLGAYRLALGEFEFLVKGGQGALQTPWLEDHLYVIDLGDTLRIDTEAAFADPRQVRNQRAEALAMAGRVIHDLVLRAPAEEVMVIVASPSASHDMIAAKDEVAPIVIAADVPLEVHLFPAAGVPIGSLTSDTTHRNGLVSNEDVAPAILAFFDIATPAEMHGSPIRIQQDNVAAPLLLHRVHLANRRMTVPVQVTAGLVVTFTFFVLLGLVALERRGRIPRLAPVLGGALALLTPAVTFAMVVSGELRPLTYGEVVPFLVGVTAVGILAVQLLRPLGRFLPAAALGAAILVAMAFEAADGWDAMLAPLFGGGALDGARFYGMPNVAIGMLLGSAAYVAAVLPMWPGFAVLVYTGFFIGLPDIGANIDGSVTLFLAAGLWLGLRAFRRFRWPQLLLVAGVTVAGTAAVLAAHRYLADVPTHGTRLVTTEGSFLWRLWDLGLERVEATWRLIADVPFALVPVVGMPIVLWLLLRPPRWLRPHTERNRAWRDALLVIVVGSIAAFLLNDSGPAAAGLGFAMGLGGMLYLMLVDEPVEPAPDEPDTVVLAPPEEVPVG
jgi:hypothetical protein